MKHPPIVYILYSICALFTIAGIAGFIMIIVVQPGHKPFKSYTVKNNTILVKSRYDDLVGKCGPANITHHWNYDELEFHISALHCIERAQAKHNHQVLIWNIGSNIATIALTVGILYAVVAFLGYAVYNKYRVRRCEYQPFMSL